MIFLDAAIKPGNDFAQELVLRAQRARVLLVVIGPRWLTAADTAGRRLIDDPRDWVRQELIHASAAGARIIPVLTDGATPPTVGQLPTELGWLGRCQFLQLRLRDVIADLRSLRDGLLAASPRLAEAARQRSQ
jgi:hypothetical protein